jgi:hypothetical protein
VVLTIWCIVSSATWTGSITTLPRVPRSQALRTKVAAYPIPLRSKGYGRGICIRKRFSYYLDLQMMLYGRVTVAWLSLLSGIAACGFLKGAKPVEPGGAPTRMRFTLLRGDAQPQTVVGARFAVTLADANGARTITSTGLEAPWREYRISDAGPLRVHVTVRGESPYVRGDAMTSIPLHPDLFLDLFVYAWSPSMDPHLHGCRCQHRLAFPLQTASAVNDSLIIAWSTQRISCPNPPG